MLGRQRTMVIKLVNWDEVVTAQPPWLPEGWRLWAVWPSPVDHDACFEAAGFRDFADSDEDWDADFACLVQQVMGGLEKVGIAKLNTGEYPIERGHRRESLVDALIAAATDDNFQPCTVTFEETPRAFLRTSDGHRILWVALRSGALDVVAVVEPRDVRETTLDWARLV